MENNDFVKVIETWNHIKFAPGLLFISEDSKKGRMLKARIKEYGLEVVLDTISRLADYESILKRQVWFDFEWFLKPHNFSNVLEGALTLDPEGSNNT